MAKAKKQKEVVLNQYEAMFLMGANFTAELENAMKILRAIIERHAGQILVIKKWDERKLAYEIKGQKRGLYIICYFNAPAPAVMAIERDVNLSDQVLRVLITKADHLNPEEMAAVEPQPIQPREERNPWDRPSYDDRPMGGGGGRDRGDRSDRPPRREESPEAAVGKE
jgi:small subunit ribosomal protein S6